jgi:hypothetical protein
MKKILIISILFLLNISSSIADDGMWIPMLLEKTRYSDMVKKGLQLSAEDIYSINRSSLKDAVGLFGGGCTCEIVSEKGLILTNHHCGYGAIQEHSSVDNDLLTNGFWAKNYVEELLAKYLTVTFLIRMEDVTERVLKNLKENITEKERNNIINDAIKTIKEEAIKGTHYDASVKPLFYGNQYFLYVTETFKDIRLVGTPPSAIGKFGGDTDNWMWPRHTGDFSVFRIYADKNNNPADYSIDNVPYKPKKSLTISLKGFKKDDFTMVYGYPFYTYEYLPSKAIELLVNTENPIKIKIRRKKMDVIESDMNQDTKIRIQYSSKQAGIANGWKKWIGQNMGLEKIHAIEKKKEFERSFMKWAELSESRKRKYYNILPEFEKLNKELEPLVIWKDYYNEAIGRLDAVGFASEFKKLTLIKPEKTNELKSELLRLKLKSENFFKDFNVETEKKIFYAMMKIYLTETDTKNYPEILNNIFLNKFKGDLQKYTDYVFAKSYFVDVNRTKDLLEHFNKKTKKNILNDPLFKFTDGFNDYYSKNYKEKHNKINIKLDSLNRIYMAGIMEMQKEIIIYPDANATLRLTYGNVDNLFPRDAVEYDYFTTLDGIIEKDNPEIYDYNVPQHLKELYYKKDFDVYGEDNKMSVCFIASNHTSGGNSGSPVLNSKGELIGINFDRNWEGTMSDIYYDSELCRNISLDIRYCLFIIDKFAGAKNIVNEMNIVR